MRAVCGPDEGPLEPEIPEGGVVTYSDAFFAKGLVRGAARYAPADLGRQLDALARVIAAIKDGRFQMAEKVPLSRATTEAELDDFRPRMILLGAAGMLCRLGQEPAAAYADRFVSHVPSRYLDPTTNLLRDVPGGDACNVGHGIEFVGFALDHLGPEGDPGTIRTLERVLVASFERGLDGPGIRLSVSAATGRPLSPFCPWWPLPETVRSAALAHAETGSADTLRIWRTADARFHDGYWRDKPPIAYQCLTDDGPVDYVPATPDLDPGYHTGLSLLAAAGVAQEMTGGTAQHENRTH